MAPFHIDVDRVYAAARSLWGAVSDTPVSASDVGMWPVKATAAISIGNMELQGHYRRKTHAYRCFKEDSTKEKQSIEYYLRDEDGILRVLLEAGLAKRFVELLLLPNDAAIVRPDLDPWYMHHFTDFAETKTFTVSSALQYCVCQV